MFVVLIDWYVPPEKSMVWSLMIILQSTKNMNIPVYPTTDAGIQPLDYLPVREGVKTPLLFADI